MKNQMAATCICSNTSRSWSSRSVGWLRWDREWVMPTAIFPEQSGKEEPIGHRKVEQISRNVGFTSSFTIKVKHKKGRLLPRLTTKVVSSANLPRSPWAKVTIVTMPAPEFPQHFVLSLLFTHYTDFWLEASHNRFWASRWQNPCLIYIYIPKFNK